MTSRADKSRALDRCDRELAAIAAESPNKPAWLVTLGTEDWLMEKRLIEQESDERKAAHAATGK